MHWVLQASFLSEPGRSALIAALERFGISYSVHKVVPKEGDLIPEPELKHKNVICFGSYSLRPAVLRNQWSPGLFDVLDQDFETQREHWGAHMLNFDSVVSSVRDAAFTTESMFVRPVNDSKYFSGRIFTAQEFGAWQRSICQPEADRRTSLAPQTRIQLAPLVTIHAEYRFWIVKNEIITQSLYRLGGKATPAREVDEKFASFVNERIRQWTPHETFVIDVCDTPGGIKIVEVNTLNCSASYAADVQRLVLALEQAYSQ
ncbi:conserved hypothetical protein [Chthoniobacter flavus Ellin428]|uniref:ATP-grasp domain-containing protein n=1 Tax=Chthoniobacter flavus Ellin428 TaxID=497964 RepID=B4CVD6_9BACT|nr:ATP-grasp domain-containing protein [Chthoniobacter flavus]EDY21378.1 conserved hypothetical protein [Chthoniobacter flavus Ellin428]TCO95342.1 uncharacterized protein DUF4343 [Chthoniobacter flavus]